MVSACEGLHTQIALRPLLPLSHPVRANLPLRSCKISKWKLSPLFPPNHFPFTVRYTKKSCLKWRSVAVDMDSGNFELQKENFSIKHDSITYLEAQAPSWFLSIPFPFWMVSWREVIQLNDHNFWLWFKNYDKLFQFWQSITFSKWPLYTLNIIKFAQTFNYIGEAQMEWWWWRTPRFITYIYTFKTQKNKTSLCEKALFSKRHLTTKTLSS